MMRDLADGEDRELPAYSRMRRALSVAGRRALDLLLPPQCPITGAPVAAPGHLSAAGWAHIRFIDDPVCIRCGAPFAHDHGEAAECAGCLAAPPSFDAARAAIVYDEASHKLVVGFKHADKTELAGLFGRWMALAGVSFFEDATFIAPTPLHRRRLLARRYNQAGLLAAALSTETGKPVIFDSLMRTRATPPQKALSASARRRNVAGAFAVSPARAAAVKDAHIVLVDDVLTTGATLSACARALKKGGAASVTAVVLAKVVRDGAGGQWTADASI